MAYYSADETAVAGCTVAVVRGSEALSVVLGSFFFDDCDVCDGGGSGGRPGEADGRHTCTRVNSKSAGSLAWNKYRRLSSGGDVAAATGTVEEREASLLRRLLFFVVDVATAAEAGNGEGGTWMVTVGMAIFAGAVVAVRGTATRFAGLHWSGGGTRSNSSRSGDLHWGHSSDSRLYRSTSGGSHRMAGGGGSGKDGGLCVQRREFNTISITPFSRKKEPLRIPKVLSALP